MAAGSSPIRDVLPWPDAVDITAAAADAEAVAMVMAAIIMVA